MCHDGRVDTAADISQVTDAARRAARVLANATTQVKNRGLEAIAAALIERSDQILAANAEDVARGRAEQMSEGLLDRLALTPDRIRGIAEAVREIAGLPDPIGQVVRGMRTDIGLRVTQERVPLGVIGIIYEARPNVTIDAASLALKAGNAVVLRGGSAAQSSNRVLIEVCRDALTSVGLPADAITTVDPWGRAGARAMMRARGAIDALIPRGGAGLINAVVEESRVPVIETGTGNCHVYVDASADLAAAEAIIMNAKTQRVGVCNAAETLLVHADVAQRILVAAITRLTTAGVTIHADEATRAIVDGQPSIDADMIEDAIEAVDAVVLWWREDDGDVVDGLVDAMKDLAATGFIWLLTPKVGRPGYVAPSALAEGTATAGLSLTSSANVSPDWQAHKVVRPKGTARR